MDWTATANIATGISAVVGCASLWSVFYTYQKGKKEEKARTLRDALVASRTLSKQLDSLLNYEMGYEVAQCVVSPPVVRIFLKQVHDSFFANASSQTKEDLEKFLKTNTPMIVSPIHSPIVDQFETKLALLHREQAVVEFYHPGVGRIVTALSGVFQNTFRGQKQLVHDEDAWGTALLQVFGDKEPSDSDFENFQNRLTLMFVGTWLKIMKDVNQPNIDDAIRSLELVIDLYLNKNANQLAALSRYEKSKKMIPPSKTKTIADDLREAEKCLDKALAIEDLLLLRQYSAQMEARSKKASGKET